MRRWIGIVCVIFLLSGCKSTKDALDTALDLRQRILNAEACSFHAAVTADYGDSIYHFKMSCSTNKSGQLNFIVTEPESISGICGKIDLQSSHLTFDDKVLAFSPLADGQITPVYAPWIFYQTLRSGYVSACGANSDGYLLQINDSYEEDALELTIQLNKEQLPIFAQIVWQGRRILSLEIEDFTLS